MSLMVMLRAPLILILVGHTGCVSQEGTDFLLYQIPHSWAPPYMLIAWYVHTRRPHLPIFMITGQVHGGPLLLAIIYGASSESVGVCLHHTTHHVISYVLSLSGANGAEEQHEASQTVW